MSHHASASFKNVASESSIFDTPTEGPPLSSIIHHREFEGDLTGKSEATIQACLVSSDRFGYVGTDRFSGTVKERAGTFVFQHGGIRESGRLRPFGFIVAGSGTGDLAGIRGDILISVNPEGTHSIQLDYEFET